MTCKTCRCKPTFSGATFEWDALVLQLLLSEVSRGGPQGCEMSRISHCLDNRLSDGGEAVSLTRRPRFTPQEYFWYSFLLEAESTLGENTITNLERAHTFKNNMAGICTSFEVKYYTKFHITFDRPSTDQIRHIRTATGHCVDRYRKKGQGGWPIIACCSRQKKIRKNYQKRYRGLRDVRTWLCFLLK
jgi:hypothetical protein